MGSAIDRDHSRDNCIDVRVEFETRNKSLTRLKFVPKFSFFIANCIVSVMCVLCTVLLCYNVINAE